MVFGSMDFRGIDVLPGVLGIRRDCVQSQRGISGALRNSDRLWVLPGSTCECPARERIAFPMAC